MGTIAITDLEDNIIFIYSGLCIVGFPEMLKGKLYYFYNIKQNGGLHEFFILCTDSKYLRGRAGAKMRMNLEENSVDREELIEDKRFRVSPICSKK